MLARQRAILAALADAVLAGSRSTMLPGPQRWFRAWYANCPVRFANVISYEEYHPYGTTAYRATANVLDKNPKRYAFTGKERDENTSGSAKPPS